MTTNAISNASPADFPSDFQWGVATSSYQIEGCVDLGGRGTSIWDTFSRTAGKTVDGDTGDLGIDHYRLFKRDVAIMADLGVSAYRFSIAWPRLLPEGVGAVTAAGMTFYRELCEELLANNITPVATLYHWDLPQALEDRGGWLNPESPDWFADYAAVAKEGLGDLITSWWTLNEPWCSAFLGYGIGIHAPGIQDQASMYLAAHHLMLGHHKAVAAMRSVNPRDEDTYGIVLNTGQVVPNSDSPEDAAAARDAQILQSDLYCDASVLGTYPDLVREAHEFYGLADRIDCDELAAVAQPLDLLGVNYYNMQHIEHQAGSPADGVPPGSNVSVVAPTGPLTTMGWPIQPHGLTMLLKRLASQYPDLPLVVTENGAAFDDQVEPDGSINDQDRVDYISSHIAAVHDALDDGVDVRGYFAWSLFDNFEWSFGYSQRFGIVRVDYETLERTIKASGLWYKEFLHR